MNEYVKSWRFVEHFSKWKLCILLVPVRSLVDIVCPLNVAVLTLKMGSMYGSSVICFYGKGLRINNYTYLMLISRSIKFQSELSGGGIIWPHMQSSNTAEEVTQKIADWATNQLDWSKFQEKNLIHSLSSPKLKSAPSVRLFCNALTQAFEKVDYSLRIL